MDKRSLTLQGVVLAKTVHSPVCAALPSNTLKSAKAVQFKINPVLERMHGKSL